MTSGGKAWCVAVLCGLQLAVSAEVSHAPLRRAKLGGRLAAFRLNEIDGRTFTYQPGGGRVSVVVFLAAYQKRSQRAIGELKDIVSDLQRNGHPLDFLIVVSSSERLEYFQKLREELKLGAHMLIDQNDQLWGRLGVIATPTVVVADKDGRISWIRAGHAYDFAWEARAKLGRALGLVNKTGQQRKQVKVLVNDATQDRAKRRVRMARLLADKGRIGSAIAELKKAEALMPQSVEVQLEIGRLLCRSEQAEEALSVVQKIKATKRADEATVKMLSGWAYRQLGDPDRAEKLLRESVRLNPKSVRAFYELGKIHHGRGQAERAMEAYHRALSVQFEEAPFSPALETTTSQPTTRR